jgi:DNA-binding transcriptional ArsR family regulator
MGEQSPRRDITDVEALKLLAHPLRYRMMDRLRQGPATSTTLAQALGLNSGATSYHLRQMAQHGFIEEVPELARGRERWWRARRMDIRVPRRSEQSAEMRPVMDQLNRLDFAADMEQFARFQLERAELGKWADALLFSRGSVRISLDELTEFFEEYIELLNRYRRPEQETPPGARTLVTRFLAFPAPTVDDPVHHKPVNDTPADETDLPGTD